MCRRKSCGEQIVQKLFRHSATVLNKYSKRFATKPFPMFFLRERWTANSHQDNRLHVKADRRVRQMGVHHSSKGRPECDSAACIPGHTSPCQLRAVRVNESQPDWPDARQGTLRLWHRRIGLTSPQQSFAVYQLNGFPDSGAVHENSSQIRLRSIVLGER